MSGYSYEGYLAYIEKHHANEPSANEDFILNFERYVQAKNDLRKGKIFKGLAGLCRVIFCSKYYRPNIIQSIKIALITKLAK